MEKPTEEVPCTRSKNAGRLSWYTLVLLETLLILWISTCDPVSAFTVCPANSLLDVAKFTHAQVLKRQYASPCRMPPSLRTLQLCKHEEEGQDDYRLLSSFRQVGRKLLRAGYYSGLVEAVIDCAQYPGGFVVIDCPSGSGKTQAGVALRELDSVENTDPVNIGSEQAFRVVHLVWPSANLEQTVYDDILKDQRKQGIDCLHFFTVAKSFYKSHASSDISRLSTEEIWTQLVQHLFTKKPELFKDVSDVINFMTTHRLDGKTLVLFIDEVPKDPVEVQNLLILREALRKLPNVVPIFAGLNARLANVVSFNRGYSTSRDSSKKSAPPWSLFFTRLPRFDLEASSFLKTLWNDLQAYKDNADPGVNAIYDTISLSMENGGNPRLIYLAVLAFRDVMDLVGCNDRFYAWQSEFSKAVVISKFTYDGSLSEANGGIISQMNLLLEASCQSELSDVTLSSHFAYRSVPDNGLVSCTGPHVGLKDCGGWMYVADDRNRVLGEKLQFYPGPQVLLRDGGSYTWETSVFAPLHKDPLLYLSSCRKGGYFTVYKDGEQIDFNLRTHEVVLKSWTRTAGLVNYRNPAALSNDGSLLEVMTAAALCNAAARGESEVLDLCSYFVQFMLELGVPINGKAVYDVLSGDSFFKEVFIPRCLFPNAAEIKSRFMDFIATLKRMPNLDEFDLLVSGLRGWLKSFRCEAKDRSTFGLDDLVKAVKNGRLGVIVVRECNQYWTDQRNQGDNLDKLKAALKDSTVGKMYLISKEGECKVLDLENSGLGRIILIQIPPDVVGRGESPKKKKTTT